MTIGTNTICWTDDRIEQLKKLWEAGLSAGQIAAELGNVTRNGVIGKIHRLGLSGRAKSPSSVTPRKRKVQPERTKPFVARPKVQKMCDLVFEAEAKPDPIAYDNGIPMGQRVSLLGLTEDTCHWPVGDPETEEFFFCGGKSLRNLPYCGRHSRIAYQPPADRRSNKRPHYR